MRWTSGSPVLRASSAASWATVGARHDHVLVDLEDPFQDLRRGADVADAPAGHGVGLGEAAHQDGSTAHARQGAHGPHLVAAVDQPVVDLVAVDEQVVADGDAGDLVLNLVRQDGAGRIAGVVEQDGLGPRRDGRLHPGRIEGEVVFDGRGHAHRHAPGEDHRRPIRDVRGLVEDHLVARVDGGPNRHVQRLRRTDGDQDLLGGVVADAVEALEVVRQGATELDGAVVAGVVSSAGGQAVPAGLDHLRGRVEVRLADAQADDVGHRRQDVEEAADARARNLVDPTRENAGGERRALRFRFGVQDRGIGGETGAVAARRGGHRCVLRFGRPSPWRRLLACGASSARLGWAWSDRRSGAARRAPRPARLLWP